MPRILLALLLLQAFLLGAQVQAASKAKDREVLVAEPYVELHSGPGRGYPVFHVAERGQTLVIEKRRTDWFYVRTERGVKGWVPRAQMLATLETTGEPFDPEEPSRKDIMTRRWQGGVLAGDFDGASEISVFGGYAFSDHLSIELTATHILGDVSNGYLGSLSLLHVFAPKWRVSPYFTLGTGVIYIKPKARLVQVEDRTDQIGYVGGGLQGYLTRRFMMRLEYRNNVIFTSRNDNEEVNEWKLGFAFFL
jgi:opacity protein-like surface antigen